MATPTPPVAPPQPPAATTETPPPTIPPAAANNRSDDGGNHHADDGDESKSRGTSAVETLRSPMLVVDLTRPVLVAFAVALAILIAVPLVNTTAAIDFLAILCLLPAAIGLTWVHFRRRQSVAPCQLFARFVIAWMMLFPIVIAAVSAICIFAVLCQLTIAHIFPAFVVGLLIVYGAVMCLVASEEAAKLLALAWLDRYDTMTQPQHYPFYSSALSFGLATGEAYYIVLFVRTLIDALALANTIPTSGGHHDGSGDGSLMASEHTTLAPVVAASRANTASVVGPATFLIILAVCMCLFIPFHVISSYHIGLAVARVQVLKHTISLYKIFAQTVVIRSWFVFSFICVPFIVNPLVAMVSCVVTTAGYVWLVKRFESKMPARYLRATGYLTILGYGALPSDEGDVDDDADNAPHPGSGAVSVELDQLPSVDVDTSGAPTTVPRSSAGGLSSATTNVNRSSTESL